ncbi:MAG: hypothetical protein AAFY99_09605 [Pseudomonadota bacterium]
MGRAPQGLPSNSKNIAPPAFKEYQLKIEGNKWTGINYKEFLSVYKKQKSPYLIGITYYNDQKILKTQCISVDQWWGTHTLKKLEIEDRHNFFGINHTMDTEIILFGKEPFLFKWAISSIEALRVLKHQMLQRSINLRQLYVMIHNQESEVVLPMIETGMAGSIE